MATNVLAPLRLASVFADALEETQGNIVMINSGVLWQSQPEFAAYKLTKGAMLHMAQTLATELGPRGIRVNSSRRATSTRTSTRCTSTGSRPSVA